VMAGDREAMFVTVRKRDMLRMGGGVEIVWKSDAG